MSIYYGNSFKQTRLISENGKLALKLDDSSITGILSTSDGGTGSSISSVAKSDLLVGANGGGSFTKLSIPGSSYDGLVLKINASGELTWGTDLSNSGFNGDIADYITHTGDTDTKFGFPDVDKFIINTAGSERLTIFNNGNIGINQTNPQYNLDVNGTVNATSFRGDGSNLTGVTASSITGEASRTISVSTITAQGGIWDVRTP